MKKNEQSALRLVGPKRRNNLNAYQLMKDKQNVAYPYDGILFRYKKE